jgi:hypothetical protein
VSGPVRHRAPASAVSDPALETGSDGRTLLQARLALYGKAMTLINLAYWIGFLILWSREPRVGFAEALAFTVSVPSLSLAVAYGANWLICRGAPRAVRTLRWLEAVSHAAYGAAFGLGAVMHPSPRIITFEVLIALLFLLALRALIVPSSWRRSAAIGALTWVPLVISIVVYGDQLTPPYIAHATMIGIYVNWGLLAIGFSAVSSAVLYGLRRQVREAERLGQYTLLAPLGQGGMGTVYRARHAMLRRPTAVKVLSPEKLAQGIDRFEREVQQMARLAHANIVTVYDYGRTEEGSLYYAMELLDGADLDRVVKVDGKQPVARVVHVLLQACQALATAHKAGLVHRDIKPGNLFLCRDWGSADLVKVLDFGLVKEMQGAPDAKLTSDGAILGTPLYMAPEMWMKPSGVDGRADIYSLGAVAYYMLTGRPVFDGKNPFEVMMHHVQTAPAPMAERGGVSVPPEVEAIVMKCLAKEPDDRYPSAEVLHAHLEDCQVASAWTVSLARAWWARHEGDLQRPRGETLAQDQTQLHVDWDTGRQDRSSTSG